ncbi:MAG: Ig-like domain-containing protein [Eubacterium sp.]|nr:Ig-like domain-containing protein [Eubacterium sp.]
MIRKMIAVGLTAMLLITGTMTATPSQAAALKLNKTKVSLKVGESVTLKVTKAGKKITKGVTWKTSAKKVATVTSKGKVTAKASGKATISAKIRKKTLRCAITVAKPTPLSINWASDSTVAKGLRAYVKKVTNSGDKTNFIPKKDRIATFDMDGTILTENYFTFFEKMLFIEYCLRDHPDKVPNDMRIKAASINPENASDISVTSDFVSLCKGMTVQELYDYTVEFGKKKTTSFTNMRYFDGFFQPMVELIKYLSDNGFTVYIVTGTERTVTRAIIANSPIADYVAPDHIIGSEFEVKVKGHEDVASNRDYTYEDGDDLVFTGKLIQKNINANKPLWIDREIGKRPVLAFGNTSGDTSMLNYVLDKKNPYPSEAYMVVTDDSERDWGTQNWDEKSAEYSTLGYVPISMKKDFKNIYKSGIAKNNERGLSLPDGITPVTWTPSAEKLDIDNAEARSLYTRIKAGDYPTVEELKANPVVGWLDSLSSYYKALYGNTSNIDTPGRDKLREGLKEDFLSRGSAKKVSTRTGGTAYENTGELKKEYKMELVLGLPASGKSSTVVNPDSESMGAFILDPDDLKAAIPEYVASHGAGADAIHFEGMKVTDQVIDEFLSGSRKGTNVIIPLVSSDLEELMKTYIKPFEEAGYEVTAKYVDVPLNVSLARNIARELEGGQVIASFVVFSYGEGVRKVYDELIKLTNSKGNSYDGGFYTNDYNEANAGIAA